MEAFKAKYGKRYPEAVRSLAEEEEKTLTFYDFPERVVREEEFFCQNLWRTSNGRTRFSGGHFWMLVGPGVTFPNSWLVRILAVSENG